MSRCITICFFFDFQTIPIDRIITGNVQDNLEFLRCFKNLYEAFYTGQHNDPVAARAASTSDEHDQLVSESIFILKLFLALAGGPFLKKNIFKII
jgi:hypothetical protein